VYATPTLLIAEDFLPFRQALRLLLAETAVDIIGEASDGLEAVRLARQLQPDLILLDIGLPNLDGLKAGRQIRNLCPHSRILYVSQESSIEIVEEAFALGASAYVRKAQASTDLPLAIEVVLTGGRYVSPSLKFCCVDVQARIQHDIFFCSDEAAIVDHVAGFISVALRKGNPAVVWATQVRRESLTRELQTLRIDVKRAVRDGMLMLLDVSDPPDRSCQVLMQLKRAASQMGYRGRRVAVCGERAGNLWAQGQTDEAVRVEQLWNDLAKSHSLDILCLYPMPENDAALESIYAEHTRVCSSP
jgi:DNA-binding NarL/FixJ family response regulator